MPSRCFASSQALHDLLTEYNEWDNTYVAFSSDHGYSLGQYRVPTHKMQVYDNCLRVPFLIRGPGITPGQTINALTQFADLGPTFLQLAGAASTPASMDGRSFAPAIISTLPADPRPWRTEHLASYVLCRSTTARGGEPSAAWPPPPCA